MQDVNVSKDVKKFDVKMYEKLKRLLLKLRCLKGEADTMEDVFFVENNIEKKLLRLS